MGTIIRATLRATPTHLRRIVPVRRRAARGLVAKVYAQALRDFGVLAPPLTLHSAAPGPLAAAWVMLRETLVADGLVPRADKEAVAAAVSLGNSCPYCVQVHGATMHGLVRGPDALAIATDRVEDIADERTRHIAEWARASGNRELLAHCPLPLPLGQVAELVGVAVTFHYYNRMVNVFLTDSPFPGAPVAARSVLLRLFGRFMRPSAGKAHQPGAGLELLPAAPAPPDAAWAANRTVAGAFGRAVAAIDGAAAAAVPAAVRGLVTAELAGWYGRPAGISRAWVEELAAGLGPADRPAGRLALLTAMASYQVDQSVVDAYRNSVPGDESVVALTSWASLAAARRVGGWLWDEVLRQVPAATEPPAA